MTPELAPEEWERVRWLIHDAIVGSANRHSVVSKLKTLEAYLGRPQAERP